jgi:endonuclease/exonuclease/phosphatase family metal-dependent hydrolase
VRWAAVGAAAAALRCAAARVAASLSEPLLLAEFFAAAACLEGAPHAGSGRPPPAAVLDFAKQVASTDAALEAVTKCNLCEDKRFKAPAFAAKHLARMHAGEVAAAREAVAAAVQRGVALALTDCWAARRAFFADPARPMPKQDPAAEDLRVAEAQAVRDRVLELCPEPSAARFVIVGDFNDTPGSRALKAMQARGKTEIATWLDALDERGQRWTHAYTQIGVYSRFDQALVSEGLRRGNSGNATARVAGEPWVEVATASDHRPLVLRVSTNPLP